MFETNNTNRKPPPRSSSGPSFLLLLLAMAGFGAADLARGAAAGAGARAQVAGSTEKMRLVFRVPSRGLLGFSAEVRQETHGSATVHSLYSESVPHLGALGVELRKPKLIANGPGKITE